MYLLTSPEFSLRNEVLFHKLRPFFDTDPALSGLTVLLWESDGALKNLMDIHTPGIESRLSSLDGVFIYRTLGAADITQMNQWSRQFPHLSFYMIESGYFSISQEADKLLPDIQSRIQIITSESTNHSLIPKFKYIFINKSEYKKKTARPFIQHPTLIFRKFLLLLIKFFLTPVQSAKDFYATYNLKYFYGKLSVLFGMIWSFFAKYTPKYVFGMIWSFFAKYTPKYVFGMIWSFLAKYTPKYVFGMIWSFLAKYTPKYIFGMIWSFFAKYNPHYLLGTLWSFLCEKIYGPVYSFVARYNFRYLQGLLWMNFLERIYSFFCKYNIRYVSGQIWVVALKIFFTLYRWVLNTLGFIWLLIVRIFWGLIFIYHRIHEFNMKYTYYPFRRFYWILRHEYRKRILGITDESH